MSDKYKNWSMHDEIVGDPETLSYLEACDAHRMPTGLALMATGLLSDAEVHAVINKSVNFMESTSSGVIVWTSPHTRRQKRVAENQFDFTTVPWRMVISSRTGECSIHLGATVLEGLGVTHIERIYDQKPVGDEQTESTEYNGVIIETRGGRPILDDVSLDDVWCKIVPGAMEQVKQKLESSASTATSAEEVFAAVSDVISNFRVDLSAALNTDGGDA